VTAEPSVDLAIGFVLSLAIPLLKLADELLAIAGDDVHIVTGQFAPLLLHGALELFPIAFDLVPIHVTFLS
jgi:hypothetical protein